MDLHNKYRPATLDEVFGHAEIKESLKGVLDKGSCHAFIFSGPSGVGKTTLARIIANHKQCDPYNLKEVDAATHNGVEAMRAVIKSLEFRPLGDHPTRVLIVDEAHTLTKPSWQALLKTVEEPPDDTFWCFCTTLLHKIPPTIRTRCTCYDLRPLSGQDVFTLVSAVSDLEGFTLSAGIQEMIAQKANGSPRRALTYLATCAPLGNDVEKIRTVLREAPQDEESVAWDIAVAIAKGKGWKDVTTLLRPLMVKDPEGVRILILRYFEQMLLNAEGSDRRQFAAGVLNQFIEPFPVQEQNGWAPFLVALEGVIR